MYPTAIIFANRKLEQAQVDALLRSDVAAVRSNWAKDYVVNNPFNVAVDASKGPIQAGTLTYSSFTREIDRVLIHENTVIVMGSETVVPKGTSPVRGKRYTAVVHERESVRLNEWRDGSFGASLQCDRL